MEGLEIMEFYFISTIQCLVFRTVQKEKAQNPDGYWTFLWSE